jgi:hypothetical protein
MIEIVDPITFWSGLALLLGGWILYWMTLTLTGAVLFGVGSLLAASLITSILELEPTVRVGIQIGAALIGAIAGAFVFRMVHKIAFFSLGAAVGLVVMLGLVAHGRSIGWEWTDERNMVAIAVPVGAVVMGLISMSMDSVVIAIASAVIGGILVMEGLGWPYDGLPILAIVPIGLAVQLGLTGGRRAKRKASDEDEDDD